MKRLWDKLISCVLVLSVMLTLLPYAGVPTSAMSAEQMIETAEAGRKQPSLMPFGDNVYLTDPVEAGMLLRQAIKNREERLEIHLEADAELPFEDLVDAIREVAIAHTGQANEGDYLLYQLPTIDCGASVHSKGSINQYDMDFQLAPYTTKEQEQQVDAAVTQLLGSLQLEGKSDYEKISTVYRWVCAMVAYDFEHCADWEYTLKDTAYAALIHRTADNRGYAVLMYRMMLELGIDCRIITGDYCYSDHAWNIVKLDGKYYTLCASCDAHEQAEDGAYQYFLCTQYTLFDHFRDYDFIKEEFASQYPMAGAEYIPSDPECDHAFGQWYCVDDYAHERVCSLCGYKQWNRHECSGYEILPETHKQVCGLCDFVLEENHVWDEGTVSVPPTEESAGICVYTCLLCGATRTEELIVTTIVAGGACGYNLYWTLDNYGTLTVSGVGDMFEAVPSDDPDEYSTVLFEWYPYTSDIKKLVIENGVTNIAAYAFSNCHNLSEVIISDTVIDIEHGAFWACPSLEYIRIPDSVTRIGQSAFSDCVALRAVVVGSGVTCIEDYAFSGDYQLWHVLYTGSIDQWDKISIGWLNDCLTDAHRHSSCTGDEIIDLGNEICLRCTCYHIYDISEVIQPTCTEQGLTLHICSKCGDSYQGEFTQPLGHAHVGEVTVAPDEENSGLMTYICSACGHSYTQQLSRLESEVEQNPAVSTNLNGYDYINAEMYADPIYGVLTWEQGGYTRTEAIGDVLTVERYDENLQFISRRDIPLELPIFGGVYLCEDYNFVVVGQDNPEEADWMEVLRVVCYTKDWQRVGSDSLFGANTTRPFYAGSVRFARSGDALYIRTCHEIFVTADGLNHQTNMTVCMDINSVKITHSYHLVQNNPFGSAAHSFNQFILVDGTDILTLDQSDAYPRAIVLFRYDHSSGILEEDGRPQEIHVFPIATNVGIYQHTGVALGGFEYSDTHYLVAGNSASQDGGIELSTGQRNIFVTATPKDDFSQSATTITWITHYQEGAGVELGTPQFIKLKDGRFFLMWREDEHVNGCLITADGQLEGSIFAIDGALSDCMPIQVEDRLVWYVTNKSEPVFYSVLLSDPDHAHTFETTVTEPTCFSEGSVTHTCRECGYVYTEYLQPVHHSWGEWVTITNPTTESSGLRQRECANCGHIEQEILEPITVLLGDVNGDGRVNARDARLLLRYAAGLADETELDLAAADYNSDGRINARDARALLRVAAGLD